MPVSESVAFPELVWSHFLRQQELHDRGELHGPAEKEFRVQLELFVKEHGRLVNAYWSTTEASAVAMTEIGGERVAGFLWRRTRLVRFHSATDWATCDAPEIGHALHTGETLAIRIGEVLHGTSARIGMQWVLAVSGYLLGVIDQADGKPTHAEATHAARRAQAELAQVESYYDRAGEKTSRLVYFTGMMLGVAALGLIAVAGAAVYSIFGTIHLKDTGVKTFFTCYGMGAVGAVVSVMSRMAGAGNFKLDYEVGPRSIRRVGSFRPFLGAIFAVVLYFALRGGLLQIKAPSKENSAFFYAALAFLAGFSERRAKVLLGGAERVLSDDTGATASQGPEPEPAGKTRRAATGVGSTG